MKKIPSLILVFSVLLALFPFFFSPKVFAAGTTTTLFNVIASVDDADESGTGVFDTSSISVEVESRSEGPKNANYKSGGVRFQNITIAQGATISSAILNLYVLPPDDFNFIIVGNDVDNASDFSDNPNILNTTERPRTSASVNWIQDGLGVGRENKTVTAIIQEIIDRPSWTWGNNLVLLMISNIDVTKSGEFTSYDGAPNIPRIWITYETVSLDLTSVPDYVTFTLNGLSQTTAYSGTVSVNSQVNFTSTFSRGVTTWNFGYWNNNSSDTNPNKTIIADSVFNVTYTSIFSETPFTSLDAVFLSPMDAMFELDGFLEGNLTYRQMLLDTSAYENHGVIYPTLHPYSGPTQTWGRIGKALEFDGVDDTIIIDASESLNVSYGFTVELWFCVVNGTSDQKFLNKFNKTSDTGQWIIGIINNTIYTELWTTSGNRYADSTSSETIQDGVFYHVAMTYDHRDAFYTVYLSARAVFNVSTDGNPIQNVGANLVIGSFENSSCFVEGVLDEIQIYDYARSSGQIYFDARNAIHKFDSWSFTSSGRTNDSNVIRYDINWDNQTEGTYPDYTGFTFNDPDLPFAFSNSTYNQTFVRTLRYTAGFQQYLFYCTIKWDTNATATKENNYMSWYWNFFRHGELQVTYEMQVRPLRWPPITSWKVSFWRTTPYLGSFEIKSYTFGVNTTKNLFNTSIPIVISAWVGSNNKQFTMRFDVTSADVYQSGPASANPPYTQAWDLIDSNGDSHIIDWFDGWSVFGMKARSQMTAANTWSRMEIESHSLFFISVSLILLVVVGGFTASALIRPVGDGTPIDDTLTPIVEVVVDAIEPVMNPIGEAIAPIIKTLAENPVVQALAQLGHDVISALGGVAVAVGDALSPIIGPIMNIGNSIIDALISFLEPIWLAMANIVNTIVPTFINFGDTVFGWFGWNNGFSTLLTFVNSLVSWAVTSISDFTTFATSEFVFFNTFMTKFLNTVGTVLTNWGNMFTEFWAVLDGSLTSGFAVWDGLGLSNWLILLAILYPLFLLEEASTKGIDAAISQVTFLINIGVWLVSAFISVIQLLIAIIGRIIESIPVVE